MIELKEISAEETRDLRHRVMWPDKSPEFVVLPDDANGKHYGLFEDGRLVSVVSLFTSADSGQFRKFATDVVSQGKGYGTALLKFMISEAQKQGIKKLYCDARVAATGFYERFGMKTDSDVFQKYGNDYVRMSMNLSAL